MRPPPWDGSSYRVSIHVPASALVSSRLKKGLEILPAGLAYLVAYGGPALM